MAIVYTAIGGLMFAFFAWLLLNMAGASDQASQLLTYLAIAFGLVIAAMALGFVGTKRDRG